jgi:hypothetical protein
MSSWFERRLRRQSDLARDADLVRNNRNRFKRALILMGFGALFLIFISKVQIPGTLGKILFDVSFLCFLVGFALATWTRAEDSFLRKPDPDEPPKLFR